MPEHRPPNLPLFERHRARLAAYARTPCNFDPSQLPQAGPATGWRREHHAVELPPELPGPAQPAGSFALAQGILRCYAFPPPRLIVGVFDPAAPLAGRVMLLRARFLGFTFWLGVRVGGVVHEAARPTPAGPEQVWGYGYRTLQGHFERGQIDFSLHKNLATGAVRFCIDSVSQRGTIRNPFYWLGFRLFGRTLQKRFARQSLARMRALVAEALARP